MRFTLLGTGTSAGIPTIACDCDTCRSDDPRDRRTRCSALIETVDADGRYRAVLIDAGPDLREQALRHDLWRCDVVLLTHNHVDHVFGLDEMRRFNLAMQSPIDVYADAHTIESIRRVFQHIFEPHRSVNKSFVATLIAHTIETDQPLDLFGLQITPIPLLHGRLPILGFRIEDTNPNASYRGPVAYCTDVSRIPPGSYPKLADLDVLVLDALRPHHHPTHLTVDQAAHVATEVAARQTYFVHMAHTVKHSVVDPQLPDGVNLGHDGLAWAMT
jgi:phosphoribosyl 1,2-cyclic phosphate phosphodiesterase